MSDMQNKNDKMKKMIKKGAGLGLCAVLVGGVAAGVYQGVGALTGWDQTENVLAADSDDVKLTLTKKESSDSEASKSEDSSEASTPKGSLDVSDIAAEAMPSVVSITTQSVQEVEDYYGLFYGYGYAPEEYEVEGSGSGIIIGQNDDEMMIATNYHVVEGANELSVCFVDGEAYKATMKGYDDARDLAVVSVPIEEISEDTLAEVTVAKIGSSDDLVVGEQVVAIGNALGYGQSVTTGIVSAKNRRMDSESGTFQTDDEDNRQGMNLIQTDAAINPGNSGGALLNMDGEVVGINSAKLASTEVEGMGYAIAITDVEDVLEQMMNETPRDQLEDGVHGVLGITASTVSDEAIEVYGIPEGVLVREVTEGGAADEAGIPTGAVITQFEGKVIKTIDQLLERLTYYEPGEEVEVTYQVADGSEYKEETATVTLMEDPNAGEESDEMERAQEPGSDDDSLLDEYQWEDQEPSEDDGNSLWGFFNNMR